MATIQPPAYMQNRTDHSARGDRLVIEGIVRTSGKVTIADMIVTGRSTPTNAIEVSPGICFVRGANTARQGVYTCVNDGQEVVTMPTPAHATLSRLDIIVAEVLDAAYSGASNLWRYRWIIGTAGAGAEPAVPINCVRLARVTVGPADATITNADIINYHPLADVAGTPTVTLAERNALVVPAGFEVLRSDTGFKEYYDGTQWQTLQKYFDNKSAFARVVRITNTHGVPATTWTDVLLNSIAETQGDQPWTISATTGAITINQPGLYIFEETVSMDIAGYTLRVFRSNDNTVLAQSATGTPPSQSNSLTSMARLAAGALIKAQVFADTASNVRVDTADTPTHLSITRMSG